MDAMQYEAHAAHEDVHWWFLARRTILCDIITHLLAGEKGRPLVVDVGCGTGGTVAALAGRYDVLGVEPAAEAVAIARRRHPRCAFVQGQAPEAVGPRMAAARVVLLTDVLEHVADDAGLLAALVRSCRPGTWFVMTVPADMTLWSGHDEVLGHFRRYEPTDFGALWQSLPVVCHLLAPFNTRLAPVVRFVRRFRPPGFRRGAAGTDLTLPASPLNALLYRVFAGESPRLVRSLGSGDVSGGRGGVSLIAVLCRTHDVAGGHGRPVPDGVSHAR